ncbi:3-deoxy-D-manno-octulosonic acid transferase [Cetobacterium sp. SF1]|uniref:3-deoxy-D-manno-octulosonic acid transferase n=1 Tax=Cetobacterium sp. SF1 TaxID=3417654 RepID=UPI003CE761E2
MIYNLFRIVLIYPILFFIYIFNSKKRKFFQKRIFQNFKNLKFNEEYIWLHCSSVGEINLSEGLIRKLEENYKNKILISVFTDTGYEIAKKRYENKENIDIIYFPLDSNYLLKKIFKLIKIKFIILIETEIWPNFINLGAKYSKVILVNGRISDRSFKRYLKLRFVLKFLLKKISFFAMQTEEDRLKIINLGAEEKKVENCGNLKFDINFEKYTEKEIEILKKELSIENKKIFVAGSTRTGEDEIILEVFKEWKCKSKILVIVPRHLERISEIKEKIKNFNLKVGIYPDIINSKSDVDVILVNKMGVLRKFYSICDVAFVGGTLVNIGGHSLLEPLFYCKTPIFGEFLQNVKDISRDILKNNLGYKIKSKEEFLKTIEKIEKNSSSNEEIKYFFQKNRDVAQKILDKIEKMI